jgi:multisubunit Na+/H+ antiporter MnhB subunit
VDYSIATITVGFLIAWLGVIMVYLSLRTDPAELNKMHLGFLSKPFTKAKESKRKIKILIIIGITVTAILYAASWMGFIAW